MTIDELSTDPHPLLARLRATEPVAWLPDLNGWLVTRHDLAMAVMRDPATFTVDDPRFSTGRVIGPSMLSLDGAEHARHRAPFVPPFRPAPVRDRYTPLVARLAGELVDGFPPGEVELRSAYAGPLAVAVVADALGLAGVDVPTVLSWYATFVESVSTVTAGGEPTPAGEEAYAALRKSVAGTLAAGDPRSVLVGSGLTEDEVVSNAAVLMFGGIDTTEGMITNLVRHLLLHGGTPDPDAVEESVRLEPAAAMVDRYATRDVTLAGARIRAGDLVSVSIAGANRDPAVFPDPDRFDPRRPNARQNLAFAQGPHFCIGARLARTEAELAARTLFDRLPGLRLASDDPPRGLVFRKPPALHVRWS
ncbi:cytochrome P450 [Actinophytocola gossypii]|uniref:Cytochrome P450 n=1 Tax=Actinophytocola gossypii TaxID=2812003 RepID=A0ABT2JL14_9PSEU|nr:cytochrome P450 [Actinophytocola gossypii]MCT2588214.1 cytochrome P450 [Actinophytocola gossypii]